MRITKKLLEEKKACSDGLAAFIQAYPKGFDVSKWTLEKQFETMETPLVKYIGWAYRNGLIPLWSMQSADLQSANLQSADLRWANLRSADLQSADLQSADLQSADLRWANLQSADLRSAKYSIYTKFPKGFDIKAAGGWLVE